jgi:hypothetical protein
MTTTTQQTDGKAIALAKFLGIEPDEVTLYGCHHYEMTIYETPEGDYAVGTDDEADESWDQSLDSYIDDCIMPEIKDENLKRYFDFEKWKGDARYDGRGHSLSSYDGDEIELENGLYAYRIN